MTFLLIAFLLQAQIPLPGRTDLENPSARNPVPRQLQKDYDKLWKRFLSGKEDARVLKDSEKLLKKNADAVAPLLLQSYVDIHAGRLEQKAGTHRLAFLRPVEQHHVIPLPAQQYRRGRSGGAAADDRDAEWRPFHQSP